MVLPSAEVRGSEEFSEVSWRARRALHRAPRLTEVGDLDMPTVRGTQAVSDARRAFRFLAYCTFFGLRRGTKTRLQTDESLFLRWSFDEP